MAYAPAEHVTFSCSLRELAAGPQELYLTTPPLPKHPDGGEPDPAPHLGQLSRKIEVSLAPTPGGPETAEFTFTDPAPKPGINPYWARIVQTDMEMAWTQPRLRGLRSAAAARLATESTEPHRGGGRGRVVV